LGCFTATQEAAEKIRDKKRVKIHERTESLLAKKKELELNTEA